MWHVKSSVFIRAQFFGFLENKSGRIMRHSFYFLYKAINPWKKHPNITFKYWQCKEVGPHDILWNWNNSTKYMVVLQRPNFLFRFCTSIVSQDANGQIWHSRNLDYSFVDMLRDITIRVDFIKKNQVGEIIFIVVDLYPYTKLFVLRLIMIIKFSHKRLRTTTIS